MITQIVFIIVVFQGILTNAYYAGKGEMKKSKRDCIGDAIAGAVLLLMASLWWGS